MKSLVERVADIKKEITALKAEQQAKADSYKWYLYITEDLDGSYGRSWVEFVPENGDYDNTFVYGEVREQYVVPPVPLGQNGVSKPDNPYRIIARNPGTSKYDPSDYCYVYFFSNQKGFLKITKIT